MFTSLAERAGETDRRLESMDRNLVTVIAAIQRTETRNVILASLCGAFTGSICGLAAAALFLQYAAARGWFT